MWKERNGAVYYRCNTYKPNNPEDKMAPLQLGEDNVRLFKWRTIEGVQLRTYKKAALERPRLRGGGGRQPDECYVDGRGSASL